MRHQTHILAFAATFGCVVAAQAGTSSLLHESSEDVLLTNTTESPQSAPSLTSTTNSLPQPQVSPGVGGSTPTNHTGGSAPHFNDDVIELSGEMYHGLSDVLGGYTSDSDSNGSNFAETDVLKHVRQVFVRNTPIDESMHGPAIPLPTPAGLTVVGVLALAAPRRRRG